MYGSPGEKVSPAEGAASADLLRWKHTGLLEESREAREARGKSARGNDGEEAWERVGVNSREGLKILLWVSKGTGGF